jgi:hypothetical protein
VNALLRLVLYILAAIGLGYLVWWGANQVGLPDVPSMIIAGIVFVVVLIFGMNRTGVSDV